MGVSRLLQRRPPGDHQLRAPDGTIGTAYSHTVTSGPSEGPPATFALTAGALPSGLTLNPTTGAITGTPTTVGLFTGEITAANGLFAPDDTQAFSIEIAKATTSLSGTASGGGPLGTGLYDEADLSGGSSPTGTITIELYGPGDSTCSNPPVYTESKTVVGNGGYESHTHTPTAPGVYRWVASYSGDGDNAASATACGAPGQSATIDAPLDVSASGSGTGYVDSSPAGIDCGTGSHTTCSKSFGYGSSVTLTAHPGTGSDFTGWSGGGCSGGGSCVVKLNDAASVDAAFADDPPVITSLRITPSSFAPDPTPVKPKQRGATLEVGLSEQASVRFRVRRSPARKSGNPGSTARVFTRDLELGESPVPFSGTFRRTLKPGRYQVIARATDSAGQRSEKARAKFSVKG